MKDEKKKNKEKQDKSGKDKQNKLCRVEIIFSQAVEEDFLAEFKERKIGLHYSKISAVTGAGFSNPKLGDAIWPQLNEMIIVYCKKDEAEKLVKLVKDLREKYPLEGIACFRSKAKRQ